MHAHVPFAALLELAERVVTESARAYSSRRVHNHYLSQQVQQLYIYNVGNLAVKFWLLAGYISLFEDCF